MCASFEMDRITAHSIVADMMDFLGMTGQPTTIYQESQSVCGHHVAIACAWCATDFTAIAHHAITSIVEWMTVVQTTCNGILGDLAVVKIYVDPTIYHPGQTF
jgi:hypothetical protein